MRRSCLAIAAFSIASIITAHAQTATSYDELAKSEGAANTEAGKRVAPEK